MAILGERLASNPICADDIAYAFFQRRVKALTGIDLTAYKSQQMRRRLGTLIARNKVANLYEYARVLEQPAKLQEFLDFFTINVSEFFRIPEKFEYLERHIVPKIMVRGREFRVWSAGCSNGSEPYSLAMMLEDMAPNGRWSVLATDVDRSILKKAQKGEGYSPADIRNVSNRRLQRYFQRDTSGYRVVDSLKRRIRFQHHDLLKDPFESGFQLILCRHVVIYFTEEAKDILYKKFADSLVEGGILFVGGTEIIPRAREIGLENVSISFYRKTSASR
ncbi:MAG: CheR family methyltransferase [Chloroflexota bacterium]|jgi:chemotaxis protein methyltransferase CheR